MEPPAVVVDHQVGTRVVRWFPETRRLFQQASGWRSCKSYPEMPTKLQNETVSLPCAGRGSQLPRGERLRIMHVVNYLRRGGMEFGILKLMTGLGDQYFEHRLCTTGPLIQTLFRLTRYMIAFRSPYRSGGLHFPSSAKEHFSRVPAARCPYSKLGSHRGHSCRTARWRARDHP